jgi:hypothetical protein
MHKQPGLQHDLTHESARWQGARRSKWRSLGLLILFDVLLVVMVVLSFQRTELVQEEVELRQTREVYDIQVHQQIITQTVIITEVVPHGSVQ